MTPAIQISFYSLPIWQLIKNVSSSTSHKKTPSLRLSLFRLSVFTSIRLYENLWPNPSPNAFPKLCEHFSARFTQNGGGRFPLFALWRNAIFFKIKYDLMRPVLCYVEVLWFFKASQSFDQNTTMTYVLMDNFLSLFFSIFCCM